MILDFDDHAPDNDGMPWMLRLKELNPAFKVTLFSVPGLGSNDFWASHPDWVQLALHGHLHPDSYECSGWSYARMEEALLSKPEAFVDGWKSPGWQTSDEVYECLEDYGFWVADQHLEDHRRPPGLHTYFYEDGADRWHGHTHNVCGNGIEETWDKVAAMVAAADSFQFCSEAAGPWK